MANPRNFNQSAAFTKQLHPTDATRKDVLEQLRALRSNMTHALDQISRLHAQGKTDKAAFTCAIVADHRAKIGILADRLVELSKLEAKTEQPIVKPSKLRSVTKVHRHKRWSDK